VALVLAAVAFHVALPTYPDYDPYANLVWGAALAGGDIPDVREPLAPTPHPLMVAAGALLSPLGTVGEHVYSVLILLAFAALIVAVFRIGRATLGTGPALAGAALTAVAPALAVLVVGAGTDVPFLALVAWAIAVEVQAPGRRPYLVLALLALAGLLRPEAWLLTGTYLALQAWRTRRVDVGALALAASAPLLWVGLDLVLTGDPLHSATHTTSLADELGRSRGPLEAPVLLVKALAHLCTPPGLALGVLGVALALRLRTRRQIAPLLALLAIGLGVFVLIVVGGFSAVDRYAWLAALPLFLFAGFALVGFLGLPGGRTRSRWMAASAVAVVVGLVGMSFAPPDVSRIRREFVSEPADHDAYARLLGKAAVRDGARCGPVSVDGYYRIPVTRWLLDQPTAEVQTWQERTARTGVLILPVEIDDLPRDDPAASGVNRAFLAGRRSAEVSGHGLHAFIACPS
jgi:hypothetical protein